MRFLGFIFLLTFASGGALAQTTYKAWSNPDSAAAAAVSENKLQDFINKLNDMVNKAEQSRAADPIFLRDLRDLADGFNRPWQTLILSDDFLDGNYEVNPVWQVTAGEYWVEKGWGLRSAIKPQARDTSTPTTRQRNKDAAAAIFGQILNQALGGQQQATSQSPPPRSRATIHTSATIPNAFALEASLSSWGTEGRIVFSMYQGKFDANSRPIGYRLVYIPGGRLELIRTSSRGSNVMDTATLAKPLEDKNFHAIEWLRYPDGRMTVSVDGAEVLSVTDRRFRDPFNGLALTNRGGDYILKQVKISGAR